MCRNCRRRKLRHGFGVVAVWALAIWGMVASSSALGAVETTTLSGKVYLAGGVVATSGSVTAELSDEGSTDDSGTTQRVAGRVTGSVGSDGSVTMALVPNDAITPTGTYYDVTFSVRSPVRVSWSERWSVTTSPDPVEVGDITRLDAATGITVGSYVAYVGSAPSGSCTTGTEAPRIVETAGDMYACSSGTWTLVNDADLAHVNGANCGAGNYPLGVDGAGAVESCTADDDQPDDDSEVPDAITLAGGTVGTSAITLVQSTTPTPTADGVIEWDTDNDRIVVGDSSGQATFWPGAHATPHTNGANCSAGNAPLGVDDAGAVESCFDVATQTELDNADHGALAGLTDDDHTQYAGLAQTETITGAWTFPNGSTLAPVVELIRGDPTNFVSIDSESDSDGDWKFAPDGQLRVIAGMEIDTDNDGTADWTFGPSTGAGSDRLLFDSNEDGTDELQIDASKIEWLTAGSREVISQGSLILEGFDDSSVEVLIGDGTVAIPTLTVATSLTMPAGTVTSSYILDGTIAEADMATARPLPFDFVAETTNVTVSSPGSSYTNLSPVTHRYFPGDICTITQCKVFAYGDGAGTSGGTRGVRIVRVSDQAALCNVEWTSDAGDYREGAWAAVGVTIDGSQEVEVEIKAGDGSENLTLNSITALTRCN